MIRSHFARDSGGLGFQNSCVDLSMGGEAGREIELAEDGVHRVLSKATIISMPRCLGRAQCT